MPIVADVKDYTLGVGRVCRSTTRHRGVMLSRDPEGVVVGDGPRAVPLFMFFSGPDHKLPLIFRLVFEGCAVFRRGHGQRGQIVRGL